MNIGEIEIVPLLTVKIIAEKQVDGRVRQPGQGKTTCIGVFRFGVIGRIVNIFIGILQIEPETVMQPRIAGQGYAVPGCRIRQVP